MTQETIKGKRNNCTLVAVKLMAGDRYSDAQILAAFRGRGYKDDLGMSHHGWTNAARDLGFEMERMAIPNSRQHKYITYDSYTAWDGEVTRRVDSNKFTLAKFLKKYPTGDYFISVVDHALCVRDGRIMDPNCPSGTIGRRVTNACRVTNAPAREGDGQRLKIKVVRSRHGTRAREVRLEAKSFMDNHKAQYDTYPLLQEVLDMTNLTMSDVKWDLKRGFVELVN